MKKYNVLVSSVYLLITVHLEMVSSFGASLFGNRFLFRNHRYVTKPSQAYQLREPYAQKYGPYGDNFIQTAGKVPLYNRPHRRPKFILPTIAPFGTEGFTFSPEEEQRRKNLRHRRRQRQRRQRGHRP